MTMKRRPRPRAQDGVQHGKDILQVGANGHTSSVCGYRGQMKVAGPLSRLTRHITSSANV